MAASLHTPCQSCVFTGHLQHTRSDTAGEERERVIFNCVTRGMQQRVNCVEVGCFFLSVKYRLEQQEEEQREKECRIKSDKRGKEKAIDFYFWKYGRWMD